MNRSNSFSTLKPTSSPYLNRFLSPDTIIPDLFNPQSWNRYSYVTNRPVNFNDPSGHAGCVPGKRCIANPMVNVTYDLDEKKDSIRREFGLDLQGDEWGQEAVSKAYRGAYKVRKAIGENAYNTYIASNTITVLPSFGDSWFHAKTNIMDISFRKFDGHGDDLSGAISHELFHAFSIRTGKEDQLVTDPFKDPQKGIGWKQNDDGSWKNPGTGPTEYSRGKLPGAPVILPREDAAETFMVMLFPKLQEYPVTPERVNWFNFFTSTAQGMK